MPVAGRTGCFCVLIALAYSAPPLYTGLFAVLCDLLFLRKYMRAGASNNDLQSGLLQETKSAGAGPSLRCEVLLSDHPIKTKRAMQTESEGADDVKRFPLPSRWV